MATFIVPATESTALVFIAVSLHVAAVACRMHASTVSARGAAATLRHPVLPAYFFYLGPASTCFSASVICASVCLPLPIPVPLAEVKARMNGILCNRALSAARPGNPAIHLEGYVPRLISKYE